jgi:hypothetical protein
MYQALQGRLLLFSRPTIYGPGALGHLTRPVLSYKEEGAFCDPLRGSAYTVVVYYYLAARWGCYPWLRWCVDTKGAPTAYLQGIRRVGAFLRPSGLRWHERRPASPKNRPRKYVHLFSRRDRPTYPLGLCFRIVLLWYRELRSHPLYSGPGDCPNNIVLLFTSPEYRGPLYAPGAMQRTAPGACLFVLFTLRVEEAFREVRYWDTPLLVRSAPVARSRRVSWKLTGIKEGPESSVETSPALGSQAAYATAVAEARRLSS